MKTKEMARRPLKTRGRPWARALARWLAARGVRPNAVSVASVLFAALSGIFFYLSLEESGDTCGPYLVAAAVFIQLRLLCNMLDGLIAVEGGLAGPLGEIYNDLPDRIADSFILVGAGLRSPRPSASSPGPSPRGTTGRREPSGGTFRARSSAPSS